MIPKTFEEFQSALHLDSPPREWSEAMRSLWFDANGDWESSHNIAQDIQSSMGNWIHAYLHRKEGDKWNAGYWYNRADRPFPDYGLEDEFKVLVEANL